MYDQFAPGGEFPRPEDISRLIRYNQARDLFNGKHFNSAQAKRVDEKLRELYAYQLSGGSGGEGIVYLIYNLPRLICSKFADLQVLQTPLILLEDEAAEAEFRAEMTENIPDHWARWHYAFQLKRALGDTVVTVNRDDGGAPELYICDPERWYPIINDADPLKVEAHQLAWVEPHTVNGHTKPFLRVDICRPDTIERLAFELIEKAEPNPSVHYSIKGQGGQGEAGSHIDVYKIQSQLGAGQFAELWPGVKQRSTADLGGLMPCVHLRNGQLSADEIFGRPEFFDSGALIDDINWRLATWSDINDKISHPPRIIPDQYIEQDESGNTSAPSRYTDVYMQKSRSGDASETPKYMTIDNFNHSTLKDQFEASVIALLIRHEMAPALLGLQFGNEKESGEAKSLGMGTTEAATRRDLLQTQPEVDRALTVLARLLGRTDATVSTFWRVGLPKTQAELMTELQLKQKLGLVTKKEMLETLNPFLSDKQIEAKLAELTKEADDQFAKENAAFALQE